MFDRAFAKLFGLTFILIVLLTILTRPFGLAMAEETPEETPPPTANYRVVVKVTFDGTSFPGVTVKLTGGAINQNKVSELGDTIFADLSEGSYAVSVTLPSSSQVELSPSSPATQTVTLTPTNQEATIVYFLRASVPPVDELAEKQKVTRLPAALTKSGSSSTMISSLAKDKLSAIAGFTLDNPGTNKVVFQENINLGNVDALDRISLMSDNVDLETVGKIKFDTDLVPAFADKKAKLSMNKLRLVSLPSSNSTSVTAKILRNGSVYTPAAINYTGEVLTFDIDKFSTYTIAPQAEIQMEGADLNSDTAKRYTATADKIKLKVFVDNLDAQISLSNGGVPVDFPEKAGASGLAEQEINLSAAESRFRLELRLANGEKYSEFFTINLQEAQAGPNDVSRVFGVAMFAIMITTGIGLGVFYYIRKKKAKPERPIPIREALSTKYESSLLTEEEKNMYGVKDDSSKVAMKPGMPSAIVTPNTDASSQQASIQPSSTQPITAQTSTTQPSVTQTAPQSITPDISASPENATTSKDRIASEPEKVI
jgi:hypothetical protein